MLKGRQTGLFSAAVATLISISIQDIRPNSQDTSAFYLANIYQLLADPNRSNISLSSPPPFSPPTYAVWVNSLWFLSLVISISCALLATLLRQWARRYIRVTQPRFSSHVRARIHAYFSEGMQNFRLVWAVETLPAMLHASLFLFFAGLVVFLWNVDLTIFKLVLSCVSICTILYGCITFLPIFCLDSPYYTPLSSFAWHLVYGALFTVFRAILFLGIACFPPGIFSRVCDLEHRYHQLFSQGVLKTAEEIARNLPSEIDTRAFMRTFESLNEDDELERFFAGLPGFRNSKVVSNPLPDLTEEQQSSIFGELIDFMDRTFSSDLLSESVKKRRSLIFAKAIDPTDFPEALEQIFHYIVAEGPLQSTEIGPVVGGWCNSSNERTALVAQATVSMIVATAQRRNEHWFALASSELGIPESVLRDYTAHGDDLALAILIHVTRKQFTHLGNQSWPWSEFANVLESASKFNVQNSSTRLRHEFCTLWNQILLKAQTDNNKTIAVGILRRIRNAFTALHQGTDEAAAFADVTHQYHWKLYQPSSYPLCSTPDHHYPELMPHTHDVSALTIYPRDDQHDSASLAPFVSPTSSDPPPASAAAPGPINMRPAGVPPSDNNISVPDIPSSHFAHQTITESHCIPPNPLHPTTTSSIQGSFDSPARTVPHDTPETWTSASLSATSSPPIAVSLHHNADPQAYSDGLDIQSTPSPNLFLDSIHPTGPPLSSSPRMTAFNHTPFPEGGAKATWGKDGDAPNILPSITAIPVVGPSRPSLDADNTEDHPHGRLHGPYDIV